MTLPNVSVTLLAVGVAIGIAGCGGAEEQDVGTPTEPTTYWGRGLDGYLANALVWLDLEQNNRIDSFEPFAYTDSHGFFSYNPLTGTDYCAEQSQSLRAFCLQTGGALNSVQIKLTGGTDVVTGEAFEGTMTLQVDTAQVQDRLRELKALGAKPEADGGAWLTEFDQLQTLISPFSTLKEKLAQDLELSTLLMNMGVAVPGGIYDEMILQQDFLANLSDAPDLAADLFATATYLQKFADTITIYLDEVAQPLGLGEDGLPASSADAVWQAIAQWLEVNPGRTLAQGATEISSNAASIFVAQIAAESANPNANIVSRLQSDELTNRVSTSSAAMAQVNSALFSQAQTKAQYLAAAKGQEVLLQSAKAQSQGGASLSQVTTIAGYLTTDNGFIAALGAREAARERGEAVNEVDLQQVSASLLLAARQSPTLSVDAEALISGASLVPVESESPDEFWPGKRLSLSGVIDDGDRAQAKMFFLPSQSSQTNGELVMCISYRGVDPEDDIVGQRFAGTWSMYDNNSPNQLSLVAEGYNLQMKVLGEVSGSQIEVEVGIPPEPNQQYGKFRFVLDGDSEIWYSDDTSVNSDYGIKEASEVPADDSACRAILTLDDN